MFVNKHFNTQSISLQTWRLQMLQNHTRIFFLKDKNLIFLKVSSNKQNLVYTAHLQDNLWTFLWFHIYIIHIVWGVIFKQQFRFKSACNPICLGCCSFIIKSRLFFFGSRNSIQTKHKWCRHFGLWNKNGRPLTAGVPP